MRLVYCVAIQFHSLHRPRYTRQVMINVSQEGYESYLETADFFIPYKWVEVTSCRPEAGGPNKIVV